MVKVIAQGQTVGPTYYCLTSHSFHLNLPSHSRDVVIIGSSWNLHQAFILWNSCNKYGFGSKGQGLSHIKSLSCLLHGPMPNRHFIFGTNITHEVTMCRTHFQVKRWKKKNQGHTGHSKFSLGLPHGSSPYDWPWRLGVSAAIRSIDLLSNL